MTSSWVTTSSDVSSDTIQRYHSIPKTYSLKSTEKIIYSRSKILSENKKTSLLKSVSWNLRLPKCRWN